MSGERGEIPVPFSTEEVFRALVHTYPERFKGYEKYVTTRLSVTRNGVISIFLKEAR